MALKLFTGARPFNPATLLRDSLAGVTLAAMNIPQLLGYARIAGMPLVTGLYTGLLAPLAFALFGSSRHLVVAADSATAAIVSGAVSPLAAAGSPAWATAAAMIALLTAGFLLVAWLLKLGFLADFLSRTVLVGFLAGVGVQVGVAMLGDMFGLAAPAHSVPVQLWQIIVGLPRLHLLTLSLSGLTVGSILLANRLAPRAPVALLLVAGGVAVSHGLRLEAHGVAVLGPIHAGLPDFRLPWPGWDETVVLLPAAFSCFVVILAQSAATARAFAERHGEQIEENADLLGLAAANGVAALGGSFVVNGSPTQTAMAERAGAQSQIAQIAFAFTVLVALLTVVGWLSALPRCVLAGVIFTIALDLIDLRTLRAIWHESRGEFWLALITTGAVAGIGVEQGVLLAVVLSLLRHVRHSYQPHSAVLRHIHGQGWLEEPVASGVESKRGLIVYRFNADLFYANANHFADQIRLLVAGAPEPLHWLVIEADAITHVDYSAARTLLTLFGDLKQRDIRILFARVNPTLRADLDRHGVTAAIGGVQGIFTTRHKAMKLVEEEEGDAL